MKLVIATCSVGVFILNGCGSTSPDPDSTPASTSSDPDSTLSGSTCATTLQAGDPPVTTRVEVTGMTPAQNTACCSSFEALMRASVNSQNGGTDQTDHQIDPACAAQFSSGGTIHTKASQGGQACTGTRCLLPSDDPNERISLYGLSTTCCTARQAGNSAEADCAGITTVCMDMEMTFGSDPGLALFTRVQPTTSMRGVFNPIITMRTGSHGGILQRTVQTMQGGVSTALLSQQGCSQTTWLPDVLTGTGTKLTTIAVHGIHGRCCYEALEAITNEEDLPSQCEPSGDAAVIASQGHDCSGDDYCLISESDNDVTNQHLATLMYGISSSCCETYQDGTEIPEECSTAAKCLAHVGLQPSSFQQVVALYRTRQHTPQTV